MKHKLKIPKSEYQAGFWTGFWISLGLVITGTVIGCYLKEWFDYINLF